MFKRVRRSLETTEGRLKAIILVSSLIIILFTLSAGALAVTNTPGFCKSCHEMNPEYYTWQNSAHSQIACVDCHVKPGVVNTLVHKVESLSQVYYHFTQSYVTPIAIKEEVDNSQCIRCHDMTNRVTYTSGDIKFDHSKHLDQKINCVQCHLGVAHGQIQEKGFTAMTDYNGWNSQVGKAYVNSPVSNSFTNLTMKQCLECHQQKDAPVSCNTCHSKIVEPDTHKTSSWTSSTHGEQAAQNFASCDKCHSVTSKYEGTIPKDVTVADYARTNTFCNDCHAKKPAGHTEAWKNDHQVPATNNRSLCLVCHNEGGTNQGGNQGDNVPAKVTCLSCHTQTHKTLDPSRHPVAIPPTGPNATCAKCHNLNSCLKCHSNV